MILQEATIEPADIKFGSSKISLSAGEYLQIRYGDIENPDVKFQGQCPEGKQWNIRMVLKIVQTNV